MTDEEKSELQELGEDLAAALQSPWEPGTISRAWATPEDGTIALTMQGWIDLDARRSPLLLDQFPDSIEEIETAAAVFGLSIENLNPADAAHLANAMRRAVRDAFAAALPMAQPDAAMVESETDGFGRFMPILAALITQCGLRPADALELRVDQACTLLATHRRNQDWEATGTPYALRDVAQPEEPA